MLKKSLKFQDRKVKVLAEPFSTSVLNCNRNMCEKDKGFSPSNRLFLAAFSIANTAATVSNYFLLKSSENTFRYRRDSLTNWLTFLLEN